MNFRYPNGSRYVDHGLSKNLKVNAAQNNSTIFSDRGMSLEDEINKSNQYYLQNDIAVIHKKPTPISIVSVDYPKRSAARIKEAYFSKASTTDYNGVYRGKYIDFDAKETKSKISIPLKNFHEHQVIHLHKCLMQGGICFVMIKFDFDQSIYLLKASDLIVFWDNQKNGGRKSIPKKDIENLGYKVNYGFNPLISYLHAVDLIIDSQ